MPSLLKKRNCPFCMLFAKNRKKPVPPKTSKKPDSLSKKVMVRNGPWAVRYDKGYSLPGVHSPCGKGYRLPRSRALRQHWLRPSGEPRGCSPLPEDPGANFWLHRPLPEDPGVSFGLHRSVPVMTPPPTTTSSWYITSDWPGVMARCGSSNTRRTDRGPVCITTAGRSG